MEYEPFIIYANLNPPNEVFRGGRTEVYCWLMEHNELDAPGYTIRNYALGKDTEEGTFIREFEEADKLMDHGELTAEDVRRIVREELDRR